MVRYYICVHIDTTRKSKFTRTYRYNMDTGIYVLINIKTLIWAIDVQ